MLPLKNKKVVICRALDQSFELSERLTQLGAQVISFPTIKILPPSEWTEVDHVINTIKNFDFIIFTSANAVKIFYSRILEIKKKKDFKYAQVICVGNKTKTACEQLGINVNFIPDDFSSEGIINKYKTVLAGRKVLYPRSSIGRKEIIIQLKLLGTEITAVDIYRTIAPTDLEFEEVRSLLKKTAVDIFIFTSPSTFENFLILLNIENPGNYFSEKIVAAIGPTTKKAIEEKSVKVSIMPQVHSMDGLMTAVANYFS